MPSMKTKRSSTRSTWPILGLGILLAAGLAGCGVGGVAPVVIPNYDRSWTESAAKDNATENKKVFYLDNASVVAVKLLTSLTVDDFGIAGLGLPVLKQLSDTMVVGQNVEGYRLTALHNGQTVTLSYYYKLLNGTLTLNGDNVTLTYQYESSISDVSGTLTMTTMYEGTRSADGKTVVFDRTTTQVTTVENGQTTVGDPEVTTVPVTWTLTSGNPLN